MKLRIPFLLELVVGFGAVLQGAGPTIAVAIADGTFFVNQSLVNGNANIIEGSVIETQKEMADVSVETGLRVRMGADSRGKIFRDRVVLEIGAAQVSGSRYKVETGRLRIMPLTSSATARIACGRTAGGNDELVKVVALAGSLGVETAAGTTVARMAAGDALSFAAQAGASAPTSLYGKVVRKNGKIMLTDTTTHVTVELRGGDVDKYVGNWVAVTGNMSGQGVLQVLSVKLDTGGGAPAPAAGKGAGAGMSAGRKVAIAGVIVGGATGLSVGMASMMGAFEEGPASR